MISSNGRRGGKGNPFTNVNIFPRSFIEIVNVKCWDIKKKYFNILAQAKILILYLKSEQNSLDTGQRWLPSIYMPEELDLYSFVSIARN